MGEEKAQQENKWQEFEFPDGCVFDDWSKNFSRKSAPKVFGGCCPHDFCFSRKGGPLCDTDTAENCAKRCEKFYEKYIKEEK